MTTDILSLIPEQEWSMPDLEDVRDFADCWDAFEPPPTTVFSHWCIQTLVNDQGRPFDFLSYPHNVAPGGPFDAIDDPRIRTVALQFATRLGKTFTGEAMLQFKARTAPAPMMLASEAEDRTKQVIARLYAQCYKSPQLHEALLFRHRREHNANRIEFMDCLLKGAWARSPGTLADANICYGVANEIDKPGWQAVSTSKEAPPIKLFEERFKDYQSSRKIVFESTPTEEDTSEINARRVAGSNCNLWVPCPHCHHYQLLRLGERDDDGRLLLTRPGRLGFDRRADNALCREVALLTGHYVCITGNCPPILDSHRRWMMRYAVWAPEGCTVDDAKAMAAAKKRNQELTDVLFRRPVSDPLIWKGWKHADWIVGEPDRDGPNASYGPLSSMHALSLTWGDFAYAFVDAIINGNWRNFANSWLGEAIKVESRKQKWEELCSKITVSVPRYVVPERASYITIGIDKQELDPPYPYVVVAWDSEDSPHVLDYDRVSSLDEILEVILRKYEHIDGGSPIIAAQSLFDSGFRPKEVAPFCLKVHRLHKRHVHMAKGSSKDLGCNYKVTKLDKKSETPGMILVSMDTLRTQEWVEELLYHKDRGAPGALTVFDAEPNEHWDFCEQLLNQRQDRIKKTWDKIDDDDPDDFRDCIRLAYIARLFRLRNKKVPPRMAQVITPPPRKTAVSSRLSLLDRPGGWLP